MYKGSNCDRKSQLSEILTEPLNPRVRNQIFSFYQSKKSYLKVFIFLTFFILFLEL